jgi:hypothetical protein
MPPKGEHPRGWYGLHWDLAAVLLTEFDDDGFLTVQHDAYGEENKKQPPIFELHHAFGFISRPLDPEKDEDGELLPGKACTVFYATDGSTHHGFLGHDPRCVAVYPPLKKGGSAFYCATGSFASFDGDSGTLTIYVPYEFDEDNNPTKAHVVTIGRDGNDKPIIEFSAGDGGALTYLQGTWTLSNDAGDAYLELGPDGTNVAGPFKATSGADLGGPTSVPLTKIDGLTVLLHAIATAVGTIPSGGQSAASAIESAIEAFLAPGVGPTVFTKGA